jgi:hypothetical protein
MEATLPHRPRRLGRAVSLAVAASLAVFAFSPGTALAASLTVTQTANTNCDAGQFEWSFAASLAPGERVVVEAWFGPLEDYYSVLLPTLSGATSDSHMFGGLSSYTLTWKLSDASFNEIASGSTTPNCAPPAPAVPTSKSQCSGSGWTAFPAFKNRGQCTAFVEHNN